MFDFDMVTAAISQAASVPPRAEPTDGFVAMFSNLTARNQGFAKLFAVASTTGKGQPSSVPDAKGDKSLDVPMKGSKEKVADKGKQKDEFSDQHQAAPIFEAATAPTPTVVVAPAIIPVISRSTECHDKTSTIRSSEPKCAKTANRTPVVPERQESSPSPPTLSVERVDSGGPRVDTKRVLTDLVGAGTVSALQESAAKGGSQGTLPSAQTNAAKAPEVSTEKKSAEPKNNKDQVTDPTVPSFQDASVALGSGIGTRMNGTKAVSPMQTKSTAENRAIGPESAGPGATPRDSAKADNKPHEAKAAVATGRISGKQKETSVAHKSIHQDESRSIFTPSSASSVPRTESGKAANATAGSTRQPEGPDNIGPRSPVAFHSTRLAQRIGGPELRLVVNSDMAGQIQLSTSLRHNDVQLTVQTDRSDVAAAMRNDMPSLDAHLHDHTLRLGEVHIVAPGDGPSSGLGMSGQQQGQRQWHSLQQIPYRDTESAAPAVNDESAVYAAAVEGRISVLA